MNKWEATKKRKEGLEPKKMLLVVDKEILINKLQ